MSVKLLLWLALTLTLLMFGAAAFVALVNDDTAMHGQGPLNPYDLDSVRHTAERIRDILIPRIIGLGVLATVLTCALWKATTAKSGGVLK